MTRKSQRLLTISLLITATTAPAVVAADVDYTKGVLIVNEDWYGHNNSTVNHLDPDNADGDYWTYRAIRKENPGMQLGCTNQYGAYWDGRLYLIAKQDKNPGASVQGGRITVADAATLKIIKQLPLIDPSGAQCDGRGFIGVTADKGYVSTSNGVWILDLRTIEVKSMVKGTENPEGPGSGGNQNTSGSLYHGQCGSMVSAAGRIFVAHQSAGLLVVDPSADEVIETVKLDVVSEKAAIGSVVKSKDGMLWLSVAKDANGSGAALPYLVKVNPATLDAEVVSVSELGATYGPANSWYAWTPDGFFASQRHNVIYWTGGPNSWFSGTNLFRYDIDAGQLSQIVDLTKEGLNWKIYGCSVRIHPVSDEIYMSAYHNFNDNTYVTRRYTSDGNLLKEYPMIANYWFPSLPVFPESPEALALPDVGCDRPAGTIRYAGGNLYLSGVRGGSVSVYDMGGRRVERIAVSPEGDGICPLPLPPGMYVVTDGFQSVKIFANFAY